MQKAAEPKAAPADGFGAYLTRFFTSSIGAKVVMSITGFGLAIFILGHLAGNLTVFGGPGATNAYAHQLHSMGALLWVARAGIFALFLAHILTSIRTRLWDRESRPTRYQVEASRAATFSARNMLPTGLLILAFLLYHLAHFTLGWASPGEFASANPPDPLGRVDVYRMVVRGFGHPAVTIVYGVAMIVLGLHMSHGLQSLFQHLGLWGLRFARWIRGAGLVVAVAIAVLFILIPVSVLLGLVA
jgi:succinate dehydrogenase / fumarate reductase cytochrome b subunit